MFDELLSRLVALPPGPVYAIIGVLVAVENVFPPVPADTAVALGAFVGGMGGAPRLWIVFGVTWAANVTSAGGVYAAARLAGRPFFRTPMGQRLIRPGAMERIEDLYRRYGVWGIFLSRFIPGVRAVVPPFAGIAGLGAAKALLPMVVASALWYGTITWVAGALIRRVEDLRRLVAGANWVGAAAAVVLIAAAVFLIVRRRRS